MVMLVLMLVLMLPTVTEVSCDKVCAKYSSMHCVSSIEMFLYILWSAHTHNSVSGLWVQSLCYMFKVFGVRG